MRIVKHVVEIPVPPTQVWDVLTDSAVLPTWNPYLTGLHGELSPGEQLRVELRPGRRVIVIRPTVVEVRHGRVLRWRVGLPVPGLLDGTHEFRLTPTATGTRLLHERCFTGLLVRLMRRFLRDTQTGVEAMNWALAQRATAVAAGRSSDAEPAA